MRRLFYFLRGKSPGNIESFISILPQVAIFLISIQLVLMQFIQSKDRYLHFQESSISSIKAEDKFEFQETPLIGGGKIVISTSVSEQPTFLANLIKVKARSISIAIDENSLN